MYNSEAEANLLLVFEPGFYSFIAVKDIVSKPINHEEKHEHKLVVSQIVKSLGENTIKLLGNLSVHQILVAAFVLISAVKVSPCFQKVFFSEGRVFRYISGERGELVNF